MNIMTMKPFMFLINLISDDLDGHDDPVCSYDTDEHNAHETFYVLDNLDYQMTLMTLMTMTHYNHEDPDEYNDNDTYSLIESSAPV